MPDQVLSLINRIPWWRIWYTIVGATWCRVFGHREYYYHCETFKVKSWTGMCDRCWHFYDTWRWRD